MCDATESDFDGKEKCQWFTKNIMLYSVVMQFVFIFILSSNSFVTALVTKIFPSLIYNILQ